MQMLAVFATQARIALEDKLRNESMRLENPTEVTAFAQRARKLCMGLAAMGVPVTTVSGLLQQSIMCQPLLSVAGFELRRDVAQKGATFALTELLTKSHRIGAHDDSHGGYGGKRAWTEPVGIRSDGPTNWPRAEDRTQASYFGGQEGEVLLQPS